MTSTITVTRSSRAALLRDGTLTLIALFLVFAAFDDITTDNDTDFTFEYGLLVICAIWLMFVSFKLFHASRPVLGGISFIALAGAVWAQREVGPDNAAGLAASVTIISAFLWFVVIGVVLLFSGWRAFHGRHTPRV